MTLAATLTVLDQEPYLPLFEAYSNGAELDSLAIVTSDHLTAKEREAAASPQMLDSQNIQWQTLEHPWKEKLSKLNSLLQNEGTQALIHTIGTRFVSANIGATIPPTQSLVMGFFQNSLDTPVRDHFYSIIDAETRAAINLLYIVQVLTPVAPECDPNDAEQKRYHEALQALQTDDLQGHTLSQLLQQEFLGIGLAEIEAWLEQVCAALCERATQKSLPAEQTFKQRFKALQTQLQAEGTATEKDEHSDRPGS